MRPFVACALAVLLWVSVDALAQGQGKSKGQNKDAPTQVNENIAKAQEDVQALGKNAEKSMGKAGKDAEKMAEDVTGKGKQGGPKGKNAEKLADDLEKGKGKGKGAEKQLQAFEKQLRHEQAKHMERAARLTRIRELAVQKGDAETIARVDKLIQKEQQVYDRKLQHLQGQPRATQQGPTTVGAVTPTPTEPAPSPVPVPGTQKEGGNQGSSK